MNKIKEFGLKILEDRRTVKVLAVIIAVITAFLFFGPKGKDKSITIENPKDEISKENSSQTAQEKGDTDAGGEKEVQNGGKIFVDVSGEVKTPGVYEVSADSRVFEAIKKAGGLTGKADTANINQAETVKDGQKISVPKKGAASAQTGAGTADANSTSGADSSPVAPQATQDRKININSADSSQLQTINGIGPSTAEKIIQYRTSKGAFKSVEDLKKVSGIGDKTLEKLRPYVTV